MKHTWDRETDVIIVGSGLAGCAAALAANAHGLDALLLEKGSAAGGKSAWSNGSVWVPENELARAVGISDSRAEAKEYLRFLAAGFAIEANLDAYVERADDTLRYFGDLGLRFQLVRNVPDIYYGIAPGTKVEGRMIEIQLFAARELGDWRDRVRVSPYAQRRATFDEAVRWGGRGTFAEWDEKLQAEREAIDARGLGAGIIAAFVKALLDRGVPLVLNAAVGRLLVADGRVCGAVAVIDGRKQTIRATGGVVLATGGYENNEAMVRTYEELPCRPQFPNLLTGDGLVMGAELGGVVRSIPRRLVTFLGYEVPATADTPASFRTAGTNELPLPHSMVVNSEGRRFGDEAFFQKLLNGLRDFDVLTHRYPNLPCFFVFSRPYVEKYGFGGAPVGSVPAFVARSDRPEGLAVQLGIDPVGLAAEIERFNVFATTGVDADFGRGGLAWSRSYSGDTRNANHNLGLLQAPFYGVQLHPTGSSSAGLLTDTDARVIDQRGAPIPGLYASGDCAAYVDLGIGYQDGLSLGRNMIFSLAAVKHMRRTLARMR